MPQALTPQVDYIRTELHSLMPRYNLIRDCIAGQDQIKKAKTQFLPKPNPSDTSDANSKRYDQYVERAVFYNVTGRTLKGMVGEVFQKDPVAVLPTELETLIEDVDGGGVELDQQSKKALEHVISFGRCGLLVDYPQVDRVASKADIQAGKIRPNVILWQPWDIINWRVATVGGQKLLSLVVISECSVVDDDGFAQEVEQQYRVLRLDAAGTYFVEIWQQEDELTKDGLKQYVLAESFVPLDGSGQPWKFIPFTFIGAENNDPNPDLPPMYDLASLNIAHYRNSADYEEACYMLGQPTPIFTGLTEDWVRDQLKGSVQLGSRAAVPLPVGADAKLLQVEANTMPKEAMEHKEEQMKALGAKLIEPGTVQQTATEAGIDKASETSLLSTCAKNVAAAYSQALKWCAAFIAADDTEISYSVNVDFGAKFTSAQDRAELIAEWQANAISNTEMRDGLKRIGVAYQDDEEWKTEIDSAGPDLGMPVKAAEMQAAADAAKAKSDALKNAPKTGKPVPAAA